METQSKPLYKVLNEQRTQDEMIVGVDTRYLYLGKGEFYYRNPMEKLTYPEKAEADAQYTALAVNNLHHLAEALQEIIDYEDRGRAMGEPRIAEKYYNEAKEALKRIS